VRVVVLALLALISGSCGGGPDRGGYVSANEAVFRTIPLLPGANVTSERTSPARAEEDGPVVGYVTLFEVDLPGEATAEAVASFYERRLSPRWRLVERLDGPVLNFRRGVAGLSVNIDNWRVHRMELAVDHEYYSHSR
jgi:hypothetical protein